MNLQEVLRERSQDQCELCGSTNALSVFMVTPARKGGADEAAYLCAVCADQIQDASKVQPNHWRCLNNSMWSEVPAVKVLTWRMLNQLKGEGWPLDLLEQLYLDEELQTWAESAMKNEGEAVDSVKHIDSNGAVLQDGDTVVLIKDLDVKGGGFTAKRGTAVRNIALDMDNPELIKGKVNGSQIFILTKFVKRSN